MNFTAATHVACGWRTPRLSVQLLARFTAYRTTFVNPTEPSSYRGMATPNPCETVAPLE
jgi:hypothetical protein